MLKNRVLFPYIANGQVVNIRGRTIDGDSVKYASPSGKAYAGGTPVLYLHDVLSILRQEGHLKVILTEGEVKALAPFQAWEAGLLSMPGVSTPGISNLQPEMMDQLRDFTVFLCYDSEERKDPFKLSPGELFTIRNGEKLMGLDVERQLKRAAKALTEATDNGNDEQAIELQEQVHKLTDKLNEAKARNIKVRVVRLPRFPTEEKIDLRKKYS